MKKSVLRILPLILLLLISSCQKQLFDKELEINGYNIGDTLTNDFKVIKEYGTYFKEAELKKDKRISVTTFNQHIIGIYFSPISESEYRLIKEKIEKKLKKKAVHYIGQTHDGVKVRAEEFYWQDSITMNQFSIGVNNRPDSIYSLSIHNERISDSLSSLVIENFGEDEEIEIMEIKE